MGKGTAEARTGNLTLARTGLDPEDNESDTLTGEATRRIRQFILDGELEPNARVNEVHLCESLSISRTPLRAALQTLAGEGLLIYTANRGFTVRAFALTEIIDTYELRALIEGLAARLCAERGVSDAVRERMETALDRGDRLVLDSFPADRRQDEYSVVNEMFHGAIHRAATPVIADLIARCHIPNVSARNIMVLSLDEMKRRNQYHHDVFDAVLCREPQRAEALMREHVTAVKHEMALALSRRRARPTD